MLLKRKNNGYTLVEVIVVISIMAFLTAIIYSSFDVSKAQSRDKKKVSDISVIQIALEQYFQNYGVYPVKLNSLLGKNTEYNENQNDIKFLAEIPDSPTSGEEYSDNYFPITKEYKSSNCISYQLWTTFEQNNSFLESKKGFNSTSLFSGIYECGEDHNSINASSSPLVYDVMP